MKLLIGYDGSRCSEAALDDLQKAGLPETCEASILSVAETWFSPNSEYKTSAGYLEEFTPKESIRVFSEAETFANHARKRLQLNFPDWKAAALSTCGSPTFEILRRAEVFHPDLIVVGSHGRSADKRLLMGSISQKILTHAKCSVRVARGRIEVDPFPVRIMIGFDGSPGATEAITAVASRNWRRRNVEVRLVAATDLIVPAAIGRFIPPIADWVGQQMESVKEWIEELAEKELERLREAGFSSSLHTYSGNPKQVLVEQAQKWDADCLFVGATASPNRIERFLLGSTSAAVTERAHCSVEVIRKKTPESGQ